MAGGNGISWFPLDCSTDDKVRKLEAEYGLKGYAIWVKLLSHIYGGDGGYYCDWDEEVALLFADDIRLGVSVVSEVVAGAVRRGIFDAQMYHDYGILTSRGIQTRFFKATRKKATLKVIDKYLLVDVPNTHSFVDKSGEFVCKSGKFANESGQIRLDKIRLDKITSTVEAEQSIIDTYNTMCPSLPRAELTPWRSKAIKTLNADDAAYDTVFRTVEASDFLSGRSGAWVTCSIDWILRPENFTKILEGVYSRSKQKSSSRKRLASERSYTDDDLNTIGTSLLDAEDI